MAFNKNIVFNTSIPDSITDIERIKLVEDTVNINATSGLIGNSYRVPSDQNTKRIRSILYTVATAGDGQLDIQTLINSSPIDTGNIAGAGYDENTGLNIALSTGDLIQWQVTGNTNTSGPTTEPFGLSIILTIS